MDYRERPAYVASCFVATSLAQSKVNLFYLVKCSLGERNFVIHTGGYLKLLNDTARCTNVGRLKSHHPHINLGHYFKLPKEIALTVPHLT